MPPGTVGRSGPFTEAEVGLAFSRELNLAVGNLEVPTRTQAPVAARHDRKASSLKTRSVRREDVKALDVEVALDSSMNGQEAPGLIRVI